jgi:23S rRNA pseudouridine1911/1915/1917 synthase
LVFVKVRTIAVELLYADADLAVCVKPVGMESEKEIPQLLAEQLGGVAYPVHRLDLNVGGVMVYARSKAVAAELSRSIQKGEFIKEYVALVHGIPPERGDWHDLLWKDSRKNKVFIVNRMRGGVKEARLTYERLTDSDPSLVHIRLYTGRSHQIRVQFAGRGFPLVGDHKYGSRDAITAPRLFSYRITFSYRGKTLTFSAVPPWADIA